MLDSQSLSALRDMKRRLAQWFKKGPGCSNACVQVHSPPQISAVTLGKLLNFSVSQFPLL